MSGQASHRHSAFLQQRISLTMLSLLALGLLDDRYVSSVQCLATVKSLSRHLASSAGGDMGDSAAARTAGGIDVDQMGQF